MINTLILQGRLTADPEIRQTQSGITMCNFTVAWSEKRGDTETQLFMRCTAWRATAEFINKYFVKGQEIIVQGKISNNTYTDKDGNKRTTVDMVIDQASFCGSKQQNTQPTPNAPYVPDAYKTQSKFEPLPDDDNLPF